MSRPKIVVHQVASVDGRLTLSPDTILLHGDDRWNRACKIDDRQVYHALKELHRPQVILEGSGSFMTDGQEGAPLPPFEGDPSPYYQDYLPDEIVHRPGACGWFTVVDTRGRVRWYYKEFPDEEWKGWYLLVIVSKRTPSAYLKYLQGEKIPYLVAGEKQADLKTAFEKLHQTLGVECIVSSAGGHLNGALLRAGLIDEVNIEFFPALIGGTNTPSLFDSSELGPQDEPTLLKLVDCQVGASGRVWLRYTIER